MSYTTWFNRHAQKHQKIIKKLTEKNYSKEQIVEYFTFENMQKLERDFCPLFAKNEKCHEIDELNCYLCACPNFRFKEDGFKEVDNLKIVSKCVVGSGEKFIGKDVIHHDCSSCIMPHSKSYILENFSLNWHEIMSRCHCK